MPRVEPLWTSEMERAHRVQSAIRRKKYKQNKAVERERSRRAYQKKKQELAENRAQAKLIDQRKTEAVEKKYSKLLKFLRTPAFHAWYEAEFGIVFNIDDLYRFSMLESNLSSFVIDIEFRMKEKEEVKAYKSALVRDLKSGLLSGYAKRLASMTIASPAWRNEEKIKWFYSMRDKLNKLYPHRAPFHVDHIAPIQGCMVCGLHVEHNLRVIPGSENVSKSNKFNTEDEYVCWTEVLT